jgi:hypothetical protein
MENNPGFPRKVLYTVQKSIFPFFSWLPSRKLGGLSFDCYLIMGQRRKNSLTFGWYEKNIFHRLKRKY